MRSREEASTGATDSERNERERTTARLRPGLTAAAVAAAERRHCALALPTARMAFGARAPPSSCQRELVGRIVVVVALSSIEGRRSAPASY
uniref:Uncharacterized protein n=1 Tax=Trichuris muris TaxID=70415 RepID=A0A5S6QLG5_TRIMR